MNMTKGKMVVALKKAGIRRGEKNGTATVKLEHLKSYEVTKLYAEHIGF